MGKIEDLLKKKFKQSLYSAKRDDLIDFADYMFEKLWKIPKERERLIKGMEISGVDWTPEAKPKKTKQKPVQKKAPKPKKEKPKPKKKAVKPKKVSDEDIAKLIVDELKDEPEETIEVAEPPKEPTANVEQESVDPHVKPEEQIPKSKIKTEEQDEVDEMMN